MKRRQGKRLRRYRKRIRGVFDLNELEVYCNRSVADSFALVDDLRDDGRGRRHGYTDNRSPILAVAHLDTVQQAEHFQTVKLDKELIFSPRLDDRLGVYTILSLLPRLGIELDVLLTDLEESGESTAFDFLTVKQYNWIVEFDRCGTGAVSYQYDWGTTTDRYFGKLDWGSFSDIGVLDDMGCLGLNIGVGYQDEHSQRAYMVLEDYVSNIARFMAMYYDLKDQRFPHVPGATTVSNYNELNRDDMGHVVPGTAYEYNDNRLERSELDGLDFWCPDCLTYAGVASIWKQAGIYFCKDCGSQLKELKRDLYSHCPITDISKT